MIENSFIKLPKELAIEEVETNFGFLFLLNQGAGEDDKAKEKEAKEAKGAKSTKNEEKPLANILYKESKAAAEASKYFTAKDMAPLVPPLLSLLNELIKHFDPATKTSRSIEKAEIVALIARLVKVGNEEIHNYLIKMYAMNKSIVRSQTQTLLAIGTWNGGHKHSSSSRERLAKRRTSTARFQDKSTLTQRLQFDYSTHGIRSEGSIQIRVFVYENLLDTRRRNVR